VDEGISYIYLPSYQLLAPSYLFMKPFQSKHLPTIIGAAIGLLCALFWSLGVFQTLTARAGDQLFTSRHPNPHIVIIAIDDASISSVGRWPWDRSVHAKLIRSLSKAGARLIAYDVNISEPQDGKQDADLASAVAQAGNVLLPVELDLQKTFGTYAYDPDHVIAPIASLAAAVEGTGFSNMMPDSDGVVRRIALSAKNARGSDVVFSFGYEAARASDPSLATERVPLDAQNQLIISFPGKPSASFPMISAEDVLAENMQTNSLRDAIVFVGSTASDLHDEQFVPTSQGVPMSGVEIHASIADTLVQRAWLRPVPKLISAIIIILFAALVGFAVGKWKGRFSALFAVLLWGSSLLAAILLFDQGIMFDIVWPTIAIVLAYAGATAERRIAAELERRSVERLFSRYVSPKVVEAIVKDPNSISLVGERRNMSVLFSDIRGFTSLTERLQPEALVRMLNAYFDAMTHVVFDHQGVLDKYIGDAVMAFWNAPFHQDDHAVLAVSCALRMKEILRDMNESGLLGKSAWRIGIGVSTGDMIVGNIGGGAHTDYTVIGDAVNIASRLEELTKEYRVGILISEPTAKAVSETILTRRLSRVRVFGKHISVNMYEAVAHLGQATEKQLSLRETYERALEAYEARSFDSAIKILQALLVDVPDDQPSHILLERAKNFLTSPPPEDWDGTWIYTKK